MTKKISILLGAFLIATSCDDIIEVEDISNGTVVILAPTDNSLLTIANVNFSWQSLENAERYTIQIATPDFENATQILLDSTTTATNISKTLTEGNYQWRIKAKNSGYQTMYTSKSFTIE